MLAKEIFSYLVGVDRRRRTGRGRRRRPLAASMRAPSAPATVEASADVETDVPRADDPPAPCEQAQVVRPFLASGRLAETRFFRISCLDGFVDPVQVAALGTQLDLLYATLVDVLGADPAAGRRIEVHLHPDDGAPGTPGDARRGRSYALGRGQMHIAYLPGAPIDDLERSLVALTVALVAGDGGPRPALIVDGLLALVLQRLGAFPPDEQILPIVAQARVQGDLPPLDALLDEPSPATQSIYYPAAAGFIGFLIRTWGPARFRAFVARSGGGANAAARAIYRRSPAALERAWHRELTRGRPNPVWRFMRLSGAYLRPYWPKVAEILLYLTLAVAFSVTLARMQGVLLDRALLPGDRRALVAIMGALLAAFVVVSITSLREAYVTAWVSGRVMLEISRRMFGRVQWLHAGFFQRMQTGDLISRMTNDLGQIEFALTGAMADGLRVILTLVAALSVIVVEDWRLALVAVAGTPLFFVSGRWLGPAIARASLARQQRFGDVTGALQESLAAQPVVKAFGLQERMIAGYDQRLERLFQSVLRVTFIASLYGLSANSIASGIQLTVLGVGGWMVTGGDLTVGTLIGFLALMGLIIGPVQSISGIVQALYEATGAMDRVDELLTAEPAITDRPDARAIGPVVRGIRLEDVSFAYADGQPTLEKIDLDIPAGSHVALVGPTGCGKSTALNLLLRLYEPQGGRVTLDGVDAREATLASLRGQMGIVFQETFLFDMSVRENIRLGDPTASDAEVEEAARAAEIHERILRLPEGYDTMVGERGGRLSGGERQRVAIARALVRRPAILLLDEATSSLDPRTEAAITATLNRVARGRTTINVTHRLASVMHADRIVVLEQGRIAEQGTHAELLARGGLYAWLWTRQGGTAEDGTSLDGVPDVTAPMAATAAW